MGETFKHKKFDKNYFQFTLKSFCSTRCVVLVRVKLQS